MFSENHSFLRTNICKSRANIKIMIYMLHLYDDVSIIYHVNIRYMQQHCNTKPKYIQLIDKESQRILTTGRL